MPTLQVSSSISVSIITLGELAKHNTHSDAWIALKGRVYDVTPYIHRHPGGVEPISQWIGKDGTKAFNNIHAYVDFATILKGHEKGILEGHKLSRQSNTTRHAVTFADLVLEDDEEPVSASKCCGCIRRKDPRLPKTSFFNSPNAVVYEIKFRESSLPIPSQEEDWSAGLEEDDNSFTVKKFVDESNIWIASYKLVNPISYDFIQCNFRDNYNTCEISMKKLEEGVKWKNLGLIQPPTHTIVENSALNDLYSAKIVYKERLDPDVNMYGIQLRKCVHFGLRLGQHIKIRLGGLMRPYTPVCFSMMGKPIPSKLLGNGQIFWFIIKTYQIGQLTQKLDDVPVSIPDDDPCATLKISSPKGSFHGLFLAAQPSSVLVMFAGGTGITPMTRIISWIFDRYHQGINEQHQVVLLFWNKTESDIIWKAQFEELNMNESAWFRFLPVLTQPSSTWKGLTGRPSTQLIDSILSDTIPNKGEMDRQALVCGSIGFNDSVKEAIAEHFGKNDTYIFEG